MLTINLSELVLTVINFFVLLILLKRFLYTPLIAFMDARNARIEAGLEQEEVAYAAIMEEEARNEMRRKGCREEARRILRDAQRADELRRLELMTETTTQNLCKRKEAKAAEILRNEEETHQFEDHQTRLAELLANNLLDHFPDMPEILVGNGLRLAVQQAENTWENSSELYRTQENAEYGSKRTSDLFAPLEALEVDDSELQKRKEEQRQLDEKWEELAALLAERLLCPGA